MKTLKAAKFLVVGPVLLMILAFVNLMATPHVWWVQWAALGISIAWVSSAVRVLKAVILVGGVAALVTALRRRSFS